VKNLMHSKFYASLVMTISMKSELKNFSERLESLMKLAGYKSSPTILARLFNDTSEHRSVSINATRKWLEGLAFPHQDNLVRLADIFQVSLASLRFGENDLERTGDYPLSKSEYRLVTAFRKMSSAQRKIFLSLAEEIKISEEMKK
jgi:hypothetical protein